jgi:large subunit ribosomal protein L25
MLMISFELNGEIRTEKGKGENRRLRRTGKIPAIVYGAGKAPMTLSLRHNDVIRNLENEAFYSHILTLKVDGKEESVVLKDIHRHPYKPAVQHLDLFRVSESTKIRMHVPLHFIGGENAPGVRQHGGLVSHLINDVEVNCLPKDLPEYIEVDLSQLDIGDSIHLSSLQLPPGVDLLELAQGGEHDIAVVTILKTRGGEATEEAVGSEPE